MVSMPKVVLEILHCFLMVRRIIWYSVPRTGWLMIMPNFDASSVAAWMHGSRCSFSVHAILTLFYVSLKMFSMQLAHRSFYCMQRSKPLEKGFSRCFVPFSALSSSSDSVYAFSDEITVPRNLGNFGFFL